MIRGWNYLNPGWPYFGHFHTKFEDKLILLRTFPRWSHVCSPSTFLNFSEVVKKSWSHHDAGSWSPYLCRPRLVHWACTVGRDPWCEIIRGQCWEIHRGFLIRNHFIRKLYHSRENSPKYKDTFRPHSNSRNFLRPRGKSLVYLAYEISRLSKGFLPKAYEISDFS